MFGIVLIFTSLICSQLKQVRERERGREGENQCGIVIRVLDVTWEALRLNPCSDHEAYWVTLDQLSSLCLIYLTMFS